MPFIIGSKGGVWGQLGNSSVATDATAGTVSAGGGLVVDANGRLDVDVGTGLKLTDNTNAAKLIIDNVNLDVTTLKNADTLVSGVYQGGLSGTSTLATLANAQKGNWWNVSATVTISGTVFDVGDQLWCSANVAGIPANLNNFVRVPATMAQATTATAGIVQLAGDLAGTGAAPLVKKIDGVSLPSTAPTAGQFLKATSGTSTVWETPSAGVTLSNTVPVASSQVPSAGVATVASRQDHVHPIDTTRAPITLPNFNTAVGIGATAADHTKLSIMGRHDTANNWKTGVNVQSIIGPATSAATQYFSVYVQPVLDSGSGFNGDAGQIRTFHSEIVTGSGATYTTYQGYFCADPSVASIQPAAVQAFIGTVSARTGYYNLHMSGSAANYLAGNTLIGDIGDSGEKLQVTGDLKVTGKIKCDTIKKIGAATSRRLSGAIDVPNNVANGTVALFDLNDNVASNQESFVGLTYDNSNGRFTNTSGGSITFSVSYMVTFQSNATGFRATWIRLNGAVDNRIGHTANDAAAATGTSLNSSANIVLANNEYFQICVNHNSGAVLSMGGNYAALPSGFSNRVQIVRLSE